MKLNKRILGVALASTMILSSASMSFANKNVYYNLSTSEGYTSLDVKPGSPKRKELMSLKEESLGRVLFDGNVYRMSTLNALAEEFMENAGPEGDLGDFFSNPDNYVEAKTEVAQGKLKVESVSAINGTTISVIFSGEDAPAEAVEIELTEALTHGQTEVTFEHDGKTYTAKLDTAYVDPEASEEEKVAAATAAVSALFADETKAALAEGVTETEIALAEGLVTELADGEVKTSLQGDIETARALLPVADLNAKSVVAENATTVKVTFEDATEESLAGRTITLTAGETALTATYKAESLAEGVATFELSGEDKLVDATIYTASAEGISFTDAEFVAKLLAPYAKTINVITTGLPANKDGDTPADKNIVNFEIKDQFGDTLTVAVNGDLKATGTVKGIPLTASELTLDAVAGTVKIDKKLAENDKVSLTFTNKINDKTETIGSTSFIVSEAADLVATTISNPVAKYKVAANGHEIGKNADEILADDEITLTVDVRDQFGNKLTGTTDAPVRWVISEGKDLIDNSTADTSDINADGIADTDEKLNFKAKGAGNVTIDAYIGNGEKVSYSFTIGAKKLQTIDAITFTGDVFNHEAKTSDKVTFTPGAVLKASDIKFHITSTPEGATASDITLEAVQGTGDKANEITVKATAKKAGVYKFIPYVGESFEIATVKGDVSTITSQVRIDVDTISDFTFDAKELKAGATNVKAEVVFKNKHGEVLNATQANAEVVSSKSEVTGAVSIVQGTGDNASKTYVNLAQLAKGTSQITVQANNILKSSVVTVGEAVLTTIDAGANVIGVVAGDSANADLVKYNDIKFLDQDGISLGESDAKVTVRKSGAIEDLSAENAAKLVKLGTIAYKEDGTVDSFSDAVDNKYNAIKIHPEATVAEGTYTVTVSKDVTEGETTKTISDSFTVTVGAARVVNSIELTPETTTLAIGENGKADLNIVTKDQYGDFIEVKDELDAIAVTAVSADTTKVSVGEVTAVKDEENPANVIGYKAVLTGIGKGSSEITVTAGDKTAKVTITADVAGNLVESVAIDTKDVKSLYSTETAATLEALKANAKTASGSTVPGATILWSVESVNQDANNEYANGPLNVSVDEKGVVTAEQDFVGNAVIKATTTKVGGGTTTDIITLNFDNKPSKAVMSTVKLVETVEGEDVDVDSLEINKATSIKLSAKDQYDAEFKFAGKTVQLLVADPTVVSAKNADGTITVTPESEGATTITVIYNGKEIPVTVTVKNDAAKVLEATNSVATAENTKTNTTRTTAQDLVTALIGGTDKDALQARLDAIVTAEDEVAAAVTGVVVTSQVEEGKDKVDAVVEPATAAKVSFTISGTVAANGDITVTVGDQIDIEVAVAEKDTAEAVAAKITAATGSFTGYTVTNEGAVVTITKDTPGATTSTAGSVDVGATGLTEISEVTVTEGTEESETSAEEPATQAVVTFTVTNKATNGGTLVVTIGEVSAEVTVSADADVNAVAAAIRGANIAGYTAGGENAEVTFTKNVAGKTTATTASVADKE